MYVMSGLINSLASTDEVARVILLGEVASMPPHLCSKSILLFKLIEDGGNGSLLPYQYIKEHENYSSIFFPLIHYFLPAKLARLCGVPAILPDTTENLRILEGTKARPHSWPWQVSLQVSGR